MSIRKSNIGSGFLFPNYENVDEETKDLRDFKATQTAYKSKNRSVQSGKPMAMMGAYPVMAQDKSVLSWGSSCK